MPPSRPLSRWHRQHQPQGHNMYLVGKGSIILFQNRIRLIACQSPIIAYRVCKSDLKSSFRKYIVKGEDGLFSCGFCGRVGDKHLSHIRNHVETHMEGLSFPCHSCGETFKSRNSLSSHKSKYHRSY